MFMRKLKVSPVLSAVVTALLFSITTPENGSARIPPALCNTPYKSQTSIDWVCRRMAKGETLESIFGDRWVDIARFNRIDRRHVHPGLYLKIPKQLDDIRDYTPMPRNYPAAAADAKFILVDLSEQFLGAYEFGKLVFSEPITAGTKSHATPVGEFRVNGYSKIHKSSLYQIEHTAKFYPMDYSLRFYIDREGVAYWMHGRDMPGYPASHGCIGLYDEDMQHEYYKYPSNPVLEDARRLFEWAISGSAGDGGLHDLENGPKVLIVDRASRFRTSLTGQQSLPVPGIERSRQSQQDEEGGIDGVTSIVRVRYQYGQTPDMFRRRPYKRSVRGS